MRDAALETISDFPVTFSIFKNPCVGGLRNFGKLVVSCLHPFILCDASNIFGHIYHKSRGMTKMFLTKQNIPDLTEPDPRNHLIISP